MTLAEDLLACLFLNMRIRHPLQPEAVAVEVIGRIVRVLPDDIPAEPQAVHGLGVE